MDNNYQTLRLAPNFRFRLDASHERMRLSDVDLQAIEDLWQREQTQRNKTLFNGKVLSLLSFDQTGLIAAFVEYKHLIAYLRDPHLRKVMGITPLSLSCLTHTDRAILIGRRSNVVSQYPGWYELAPSGGIDAKVVKGDSIDVIAQALVELEEETGLSRNDVTEAKPFALVHELDTGIAEICVDLSIHPGKEGSVLPPTPEYDELLWISALGLPAFIQSHQKQIIPLSLHLLSLKT